MTATQNRASGRHELEILNEHLSAVTEVQMHAFL